MFFNKSPTLINSIVIYLVVIFVLLYQKPDFIYDANEQLKKFGINSDEKSLIPLPIFIILISIVIYLVCLAVKQLF